MPRKQASSDSLGSSAPPSWYKPTPFLDLPPERIDGKPNIEHYRAMFEDVKKATLAQVQGVWSPPRGAVSLGDFQKFLTSQLEALYGINSEHLRDERTSDQKAWDTAQELCSAPDKVLEELDDTLDALEESCQKAVGLVRERIAYLQDDSPDKKPWPSQPPFKTKEEGEERLEKSTRGWTGSTASGG